MQNAVSRGFFLQFFLPRHMMIPEKPADRTELAAESANWINKIIRQSDQQDGNYG